MGWSGVGWGGGVRSKSRTTSNVLAQQTYQDLAGKEVGRGLVGRSVCEGWRGFSVSTPTSATYVRSLQTQQGQEGTTTSLEPSLPGKLLLLPQNPDQLGKLLWVFFFFS